MRLLALAPVLLAVTASAQDAPFPRAVAALPAGGFAPPRSVAGSLRSGAQASSYTLGPQLLLDARFPAPKGREDFAVEGHPDLAISIMPGDMAELEARKAATDALAKAGVPVLRVLQTGTIDGKPAYLHRRMETGTEEPNWITGRGPLLSATTKKSADEILARLEKAGLGPKDSELWIDGQGRVFVDASSVVPASESPEWSRFYARQTAGHLENVKGLADISISYRKKPLLAEMPGAKDPALARLFEFGTVSVEETGMPKDRALTDGLATYFTKGETTAVAKELARRLRSGETRIEQLNVPSGRSFPEVAFEAIRSAASGMLAGVSDIEKSVLSEAHALEFWRAKKTPDGVSTDPKPKDGEEIVKAAEARTGKTLDAESRAALVARANDVLGGRVSSGGLSGVLARDGAETTGDEGR
jgi:hypothetical protein